MKKSINIVLMLMLVVPAFVPWLPHSAMHAFHDRHISNDHNSDYHNHHHEYEHRYQYQTDVDHSSHLGFVHYFKDYLHVDLKKPEHVSLDFNAPDAQDVVPFLDIIIHSKHYKLANHHTRAPPEHHPSWLGRIPIYLSTQRLRV